MELYWFITQNKEIFKLVYAFLVILVSTLIFSKAHKLFKLSSYNGLRYFRNAFLFFAVAFFSRYILKFLISQNFIINLIFEFFLLNAGFFLIYSLIWKKFESYETFSSLFNPIIIIFYAFSIIFVIVNLLFNSLLFLFLTQIVVFLIASFISFVNYKKNKNKQEFPKFYFLAMVFGCFAWSLNALAQFYFNWNLMIMFNVYLLNTLFFLIFLFGIIKIYKVSND